MANGFTLGGFSEGFNQARKRQRQGRLVSLQEEQFENEQQQAQQKEVMESIKLAFDQYKSAREAGVPPEDSIPLLESALETAEMAQRAGVNAIDPDMIRNRIQAELQAPGREEQLQQKAEEKRTLAQAEAEGKQAAEPEVTSRVVTGDTRLGQTLGIPQGEAARVEFDMGQDGKLANPRVVSGFGGGDTNVSVDTGEDAFAKEFSKSQAQRINKIIEDGQTAVGTEQNLRQMADLLNQEGLETGALQNMTLGLQSLASGFNTDLESVADNLGIKLGELSKKEEFDRLAKQVIIDGFEKFKGNLNNKEVQLAMDAFANLGRSKEANTDAIAAGLAAQQIARERASDAASVSSPAEARALERQVLSESSDRFMELKEEFESQLGGEEATQETLPEGIPQGSERVGELDGKPAFRAPDGRVLVVE